jgi:hypothetical protein
MWPLDQKKVAWWEEDIVAGTVTVSLTTAATEPIEDTFELTITFSEAVTDFVIEDLNLVRCTASNLATVDNIVWTVDVTPTFTGDAYISVGADSVTPVNLPSNTFTVEVDVVVFMEDAGNILMESSGNILTE